MSNRIQQRRHSGDVHTSRLAFWIIRLMHDNPFLPMVRNPYRLLKAARLKQGQRVLEVGSGPGFFTIPAAEIVGNEGHVYAVDVHPLAIERVKQKIEKQGIDNVETLLANASDTGLPDGSIDLAFLFGLRYIAGGLNNVLRELHRVLKPGGRLSFEKTRGEERGFIEEVEQWGFICSGKWGRIFLFSRTNRNGG
ncbi:MAG: class I SAM-dependent methyltransferase [Deltaproteobacteria bacterium]|nr:class I SAM-dependent methyltransferase [Deltaproteobacteria bacterium]MBW2340099.1 class I SAM-dependent methyltransferase [Deltaproteobacteria bacterium]